LKTVVLSTFLDRKATPPRRAKAAKPTLRLIRLAIELWAMAKRPDIADVPVALLAGGLATRLRPVTETIPKALVELAGKPFIDHQLALLHRSGIRRVVMCLGHLGERVRDHCGDGSRYGLDLRYSFDGPTLMGTGGALARAAGLLDEVFWVMYGDSYMDMDYRAVLAHFNATDPRRTLGLMTVLRNNNRWDRSNVVFRDGRLVRYDKKAQTPAMDYIDYGVALLRRPALAPIPADRPSDLAGLYSALVEEGRMVGYEVTNRFYEIGTPAALEEARQFFAAVDTTTRSGGRRDSPLAP
jgi:NDP-sugar pyrophosphorylase family protein